MSACATASNDDLGGDGEDDGTELPGDGDAASGGALITSSGGASSASGGSASGGGTATGGGAAAGGGAATGGAAAATGGATFTGACADESPVASISTTGDYGVFTCTVSQAECSGLTLNEPALFECISSHGPNCSSQTPQNGTGVWSYVALCSELGMGGAQN